MTLTELSALPQSEFSRELGTIFEHSPWIPERAWAARPFTDVAALHQALVRVMRQATAAEQLALIAAHPELAGKEAAAGTLTRASSGEQRGAGLDQCSAEELRRLRDLNARYRERFGFPFVIAVKGRNRNQIMDAIEERLHNDRDTEFDACLDQIGQIARFRLDAKFMSTITPARLTIEPLTRQAFAPFGDVIQADDAARHFTINDGNTERYHDLAHIDPGADGRAIVSIFRGQPRALPFAVTMMERHPKASQAFSPLSGRPYLVVVARAESTPTVGDLRVFLCGGEQGVNYARGVWHHPLLGLDAVSDFLIIDRAGPGENCDVVQLEIPGIIPEPD
jgi:OHCU decarboxylase